MTILKNREGNTVNLALEGRLDTTTAPQLEEALNENMDGVDTLVLDMKSLEYVSSAGLRVLLAAQKKMNAVKGSMVLRNVCEDIKEVFDITGFCDMLTVE